MTPAKAAGLSVLLTHRKIRNPFKLKQLFLDGIGFRNPDIGTVTIKDFKPGDRIRLATMRHGCALTLTLTEKDFEWSQDS